MRNDARPIGEGAESPLGAHEPPRGDDDRDTVAHDRQSHVVNKGAEENAQREDADVDPTMPTGDSTLRTEI
ncbi:MAG TPA: hypothetical protein VI258_07315 [Rhodanobacteraceae bacterium]